MRKHLIIIFLGFALVATAEQDRREQNEAAAKKAEDGNKQQLQPNMMMHLMMAKEHLEQAKKEREQKNEGKAQEEEQKAMMEQMKAQQLQQQMKANDDSAKQNTAAAEKLKQNPDPTGKQEKAKDTPIVSLRLDLAPRQNTGESTQADPTVPETTPIPQTELADLSWIPAPLKIEETAAAAKSDGGSIEQTTVGLAFDESSKGGGKTPEVTTTGTTTTASIAINGGTGGFGGGGVGTPTVVPATGSLGGGDFWSQMGAMVSKENYVQEEKEGRLHLKSLRGGALSSEEKEQAKQLGAIPGAELGDEAFWKKVGKEPAQCRKAMGRGRAQCLKTARKEFETRWKTAHQKPRPAAERKTASAN